MGAASFEERDWIAELGIRLNQTKSNHSFGGTVWMGQLWSPYPFCTEVKLPNKANLAQNKFASF